MTKYYEKGYPKFNVEVSIWPFVSNKYWIKESPDSRWELSCQAEYVEFNSGDSGRLGVVTRRMINIPEYSEQLSKDWTQTSDEVMRNLGYDENDPEWYGEKK